MRYHVVGVEKVIIVAAGDGHAGIPAVSCPAILRIAQQAHPLIALSMSLDNHRGGIGRHVVDDDHLQNVTIFQNRGNRFTDGFLRLIGGNDDTDFAHRVS